MCISEFSTVFISKAGFYGIRHARQVWQALLCCYQVFGGGILFYFLMCQEREQIGRRHTSKLTDSRNVAVSAARSFPAGFSLASCGQ